MGMEPATPGLRERKKQRTREAIVRAALRLFAERGYDQTTVADIAAEADIAPRTFFGYFAAKEDVVFHDFDEVHERLQRRLADRAPGETAIDALRAIVGELVSEIDFEDPWERQRRRLTASTPALQAHDRALLGRLEGTLAAAVARDFDLPAGSVRPRMVAAAAIATMSALEAFYEDPEDPGKDVLFPSKDPLAIVDELLTFLRGGIAALAEKPPPPDPGTPPGSPSSPAGGTQPT